MPGEVGRHTLLQGSWERLRQIRQSVDHPSRLLHFLEVLLFKALEREAYDDDRSTLLSGPSTLYWHANCFPSLYHKHLRTLLRRWSGARVRREQAEHPVKFGWYL